MLLQQYHHFDHQRSILQDQLDAIPYYLKAVWLSAVQHDKELAQLLYDMPTRCRKNAPSGPIGINKTLECQATIGPVDQTSPPDHDVLTYAMDQQHLFVQHKMMSSLPLFRYATMETKPLTAREMPRQVPEQTPESGASSAPTSGVIAVKFSGRLDNHLLFEFLTMIGQLGSLGLASVDLLIAAQHHAPHDDLTDLFGREEMLRRLDEVERPNAGVLKINA